MVFVIDLPRKSDAAKPIEPTHFFRDLTYFVTAMGLQPEVVQDIANFDFSMTERLAFVHTL